MIDNQDLFESSVKRDINKQPLAFRMRPRTLDEYIGQQHILGKGKLLRRAIQADRLSSVIFYGPPGTGKTTLASVIANTTKSAFSTMNAVLSGVKELRYEIEEAKKRLSLYSKRTILFVDEVHRWNKSQQDALLPWVENGTIILIGATTENPFFEVNAALVSRSRIFQLKSLTNEDLMDVALQALRDEERGYGSLNVEFEEGALEHLVDVAHGDARSLLNALELAVITTEADENGKVFISKDAAEQSIQTKAVLYDKEGDYHFDVISAFIKSLRGSDPDAALYWLAKMVNAGEDPRFIFRRMLISACEDVGLANPNAIVVVEADAAAYERIGLPEGQFLLAHSALYLATSLKSNSTLGYFDALAAVKKEAQDAEVPNHLRDASRDAKGFGHGQGYQYPHAYKDHWVAQNYLPKAAQGKVFYHAGKLGYEDTVRESIARHREAQLEATDYEEFPENLSFSPDDRQRDSWVKRTTGQKSLMLEKIRDEVFSKLKVARSDNVLVVNAGFGLLVWEAYRQTPEGGVVAQVETKDQYEYLEHYNKTLEEVNQLQIVNSLSNIDEEIRFEKIILRNVFTNLQKGMQILLKVKNMLTANGKIIISQTVPALGSRFSDFVTDSSLKSSLLEAEDKLYNQGPGNWKQEDLIKAIGSLFKVESTSQISLTEKRTPQTSDLIRIYQRSYEPNIDNKVDGLCDRLCLELSSKTLNWQHKNLFVLLA